MQKLEGSCSRGIRPNLVRTGAAMGARTRTVLRGHDSSLPGPSNGIIDLSFAKTRTVCFSTEWGWIFGGFLGIWPVLVGGLLEYSEN